MQQRLKQIKSNWLKTEWATHPNCPSATDTATQPCAPSDILALIRAGFWHRLQTLTVARKHRPDTIDQEPAGLRPSRHHRDIALGLSHVSLCVISQILLFPHIFLNALSRFSCLSFSCFCYILFALNLLLVFCYLSCLLSSVIAPPLPPPFFCLSLIFKAIKQQCA